MKPKVFLGSSVEGLSVAYAVQTNLSHDAEITVWSQGVFELSGNTLDSLLLILETVDFAIFVFSPDDIIKIREKNVTTVRDNVLFEFGMFLGKLGKNRVFYITPDKSDLKLPTDLLGVTPGKYETEREDSNLIAATGQASHQIRLLIQKHGLLNPIKENSTIPEILNSSEPLSDHWFDDYVAKRYDEAIIKLDAEIEKANDLKVAINFKLMKIQCFCRLDEKNIKLYDELLNEDIESEYAYSRIATSLSWENYIDKAIDIINQGILKFGMTTNLISVLASCHLKNGDRELAIEVFSNEMVYNDPTTASKFADIYIDEKDYNTAQKIIHKVYLKYPNNKEIWSKYASIASELSLKKSHFIFMISFLLPVLRSIHILVISAIYVCS